MTEAAITLARAHASPVRREPSPREKAAIIVRLLLAEGSALPLSGLPDHMQAALTEQIGQMRLVDRTTMAGVVQEFIDMLEQTGLAFPQGLEGALGLMDGHLSPSTANRLRRMAVASSKADPWERLVALPPERLLPVLQDEAVEVAAVMLSKLPVPRAADLLGRLPGDRARRIAHAVSMTGNVDPDTVRRIGQSLVSQLDAQPPRAFDSDPVARVGAILNVSPATTRDEVLSGLEAEDAGFAEQVRRTIFTYAQIPTRLAPRDAPKLLRGLDPATLVTALTYGPEEVADFLLANISQRMAQTLREEMAALGTVKPKEGEAAAADVVSMIRQLESAGEVALIKPEE